MAAISEENAAEAVSVVRTIERLLADSHAQYSPSLKCQVSLLFLEAIRLQGSWDVPRADYVRQCLAQNSSGLYPALLRFYKRRAASIGLTEIMTQ